MGNELNLEHHPVALLCSATHVEAASRVYYKAQPSRTDSFVELISIQPFVNILVIEPSDSLPGGAPKPLRGCSPQKGKRAIRFRDIEDVHVYLKLVAILVVEMPELTANSLVV